MRSWWWKAGDLISVRMVANAGFREQSMQCVIWRKSSSKKMWWEVGEDSSCVVLLKEQQFSWLRGSCGEKEWTGRAVSVAEELDDLGARSCQKKRAGRKSSSVERQGEVSWEAGPVSKLRKGWLERSTGKQS